MATIKKIEMQVFNGTDYDTLYPKVILTNTTGTLPVSSGGTGATNANAALTNLGAAKSKHTHVASDIKAGTFSDTNVKAKTGTDYTTARVRNIQASTTDLTAGTSSLSSGDIYLVYEE